MKNTYKNTYGSKSLSMSRFLGKRKLSYLQAKAGQDCNAEQNNRHRGKSFLSSK